jgi:predicted transcriptional regulator
VRVRSRVCQVLEILTRAARVHDVQSTEGACDELASMELEMLRAIKRLRTPETPCRSSNLQTALGVGKTNITYILEKLVKKRLLVCITVKNQRSKEYELTERGEEILRKFSALEEESRRRLVEEFHLDPKALDAIVDSVGARDRR